MKKLFVLIMALCLIVPEVSWAATVFGKNYPLDRYTVANRPRGVTGRMIYITDGDTTSDCETTGGGANKNVCVYNGTAWVVLSGSYLPLTGGTLTGNLLFTDNTFDIGASGATRPRTGYFGTSLFTPALTVSGLTPTYIPLAGTGGLLGDSIITQPSTSSVNIGGTGIIKGPAIISAGFLGTVTASDSTTVTFSNAADAVLAGYHATSPALGTTLISNALTRYIVSWTNATTAVVDSAVTWAGTAITSAQLPIATFVNSAGVTTGWMNAAGNVYFVQKIGLGIAVNPDTYFEISRNDNFAYYATKYTNTYSHSGSVRTYVFPDAQGGAIVFGGIPTFESAAITGLTNEYGSGRGSVAIESQSGNLKFHTRETNTLLNAFVITPIGNILTGGITAAGTSAKKVLAIGSGTAPTTSPADASQMWVQDYNAVAGDARFSFMGEASAAKRAVLGSGTVSIKGAATSGGGLTRQLAEAVSAALSGATGSIAVNVPSGARILGVQLRVDTAITSDNATKTWAADYVNTPTTAITTGQVFDANTKFNAIHPAYEITTDTVTITITAAAGLFTAGVVRAIVYYEAIDAMSSL